MSNNSQTIAIMSEQSLPEPPEKGVVPNWVHLLPANLTTISTGDQRGPYHVANAAQMIAASFAETDRLPIDVNHSIDNAAPLGHPSPAQGWIVEMQAREDGVWGRVEWNEDGEKLVASKSYRGISPVIAHDQSKNVLSILRASLVNRPNLRGLTALNQETDMSFMDKLAKALSLGEGTTEADILSAIGSTADKGGTAIALQSQMDEIGVALGVTDGAEPGAILVAAQQAVAGGETDGPVIVALQSEISGLTTKLNDLTEGTAMAAATAYVDAEIKRGRVAVKPLRDHYIAMHMEDPARVQKEIGAFPLLAGTTVIPAVVEGAEIALNSEQSAVATQLGMETKEYIAMLKEERANEEAL